EHVPVERQRAVYTDHPGECASGRRGNRAQDGESRALSRGNTRWRPCVRRVAGRPSRAPACSLPPAQRGVMQVQSNSEKTVNGESSAQKAPEAPAVPGAATDLLLGRGVRFEGKLTFAGTVRIDASFVGTI